MRIIAAIIIAFSLATTTVAQAKKKAVKEQTFTINGITKGYENGFIVFTKILSQKNDSVKVVNSKFNFKGKLAEPATYIYIRHDKKSEAFFLDAGQHNMTINYDDNKFTITNSPSQDSYNKFNIDIMDLVNLRNSFQNIATGNDSVEAARTKAEQGVTNFFASYLGNPVTPPVVSSFLVLSNIEQMQSASPEEMENLYNMLTPAAKNSTLGKYTFNMISRNTADDMGKIAPDFTLLDINSKPVTLSAYRGSKYVLVDFWATWCGPCRAEFPALKAAQTKYKDKLVILGVSIDKDKAKWLDMASKADYTNWTQVWDGPQGPNQISSTLYNVPSIPRNFLLDLNGKVIARNLRGPAIEIELEKLVK
jgi:thiol-disulfide isomerase/thioredoxin